MRIEKYSYRFLALLIVLGINQHAVAAVDVFATVYFQSISVRGECTLGIEDEPWAAINSDCFTEERNASGEYDVISLKPISGFSLGHPHDEYHTFSWNSWSLVAPKNDELYCQNFGLQLLSEPPFNFMEAGHYSNPDQNDWIGSMGHTDASGPLNRLKNTKCIGCRSVGVPTTSSMASTQYLNLALLPIANGANRHGFAGQLPLLGVNSPISNI